MSTNGLLGSALATPFILLLVCFSSGLRAQLPKLLGLAPLPGLVAACLADDTPLLLGNTRFALVFQMDKPGAILLGGAALLWMAAGFYATSWLPQARNPSALLACWLMTLTGCVGVFLAADLVGFYFLLAVLSVGASGLVLQGGSPNALRASAVYLGVALSAEAFVLAGLVMLANAIPTGNLLIRDAASALATSPSHDLTLALLIIGLSIKAGLVPLHFWMPLAYQSAPIPAAAVMSGAVVKASILALIRLLPFDSAPPIFGLALLTLGFLGAFYGVAIGLTQSSPKTVLAYSSVSQMGFLLAVMGAGLTAGDGSTPDLATFYAAHHLLAKGALFLVVGLVAASGGKILWPLLLPTGLVALGIAGLPLTGGALAKWTVKPVFGNELWAFLATLSSIASTLLMLHFLNRLINSAASGAAFKPPLGLLLPSWFILLVALLAPWLLFAQADQGSFNTLLKPETLWKFTWPILIGAGLAMANQRWQSLLPKPAKGDGFSFIEPALRTLGNWGWGFEQADYKLRHWPVAALLLLALALLLGLPSWAISLISDHFPASSSN